RRIARTAGAASAATAGTASRSIEQDPRFHGFDVTTEGNRSAATNRSGQRDASVEFLLQACQLTGLSHLAHSWRNEVRRLLNSNIPRVERLHRKHFLRILSRKWRSFLRN